jgi:hypothetical protein
MPIFQRLCQVSSNFSKNVNEFLFCTSFVLIISLKKYLPVSKKRLEQLHTVSLELEKPKSEIKFVFWFGKQLQPWNVFSDSFFVFQ